MVVEGRGGGVTGSPRSVGVARYARCACWDEGGGTGMEEGDVDENGGLEPGGAGRCVCCAHHASLRAGARHVRPAEGGMAGGDNACVLFVLGVEIAWPHLMHSGGQDGGLGSA